MYWTMVAGYAVVVIFALYSCFIVWYTRDMDMSTKRFERFLRRENNDS